tara:strand:- start:17759 stop:17959 length:201 start_codon:yes stop_codon:yes gene_type:complete
MREYEQRYQDAFVPWAYVPRCGEADFGEAMVVISSMKWKVFFVLDKRAFGYVAASNISCAGPCTFD